MREYADLIAKKSTIKIHKRSFTLAKETYIEWKTATTKI